MPAVPFPAGIGDGPTPSALRPTASRCRVLITGGSPASIDGRPAGIGGSVLNTGNRPMAIGGFFLTTGDVPPGIVYQPG